MSAAVDYRAEQSVIGAILTNPTVFADLKNLRAEHFYHPAHELLFRNLRDMYANEEPIDTITVFGKLKENRELTRAGGAPYLAELLQAFKSVENVGAYAEIVVNMWKIRKVNEFGQRALSITDDLSEVSRTMEMVREFLDDIDAEQTTEALDFAQLYEAWNVWDQDDRPVIETPWPAVNDVLGGGLQRQRLYVMGARPGCGKTIGLTQAGLYVAQLHLKSLMFSMELSKEDLMGRVLACGAHIPYKEITARKISAESRSKMSRWAAGSAQLSFAVDDTPGLTIEDIAQRARIHQQRHGLDVVCIDYLQLIEATGGFTKDNRVGAVDHMAVRARMIARKLDVAVIVAAQLNRNIEDKGGKPRLPVKSDFRESGGIEQTCDVAMVLSRPPDDNGDESKVPLMNLTFVKNRQGVEKTIKLVERFDQQRFDNAY